MLVLKMLISVYYNNNDNNTLAGPAEMPRMKIKNSQRQKNTLR